MQNTSHITCHRVVDLLVSRGVEYAVVSPGSRNAPLLIALSREKKLKKVVVVDERSAGFVALGISQATRKAVAVVCTSGTALLNLSPAIAEAYYQQLPLLVITADRPTEWIDQNDSQTLRQDGIYANYIKKSYSLQSSVESREQSWYVNRMLNEAYGVATASPCGPVQINVHIGEPTASLSETADSGFCAIDLTPTQITLPNEQVRQMANAMAETRKVLVLCGMMPRNEALSRALCALSCRPNTVVLAEHLANVEGGEIINEIEAALTEMPVDAREDYAPELLIYIGGAPVPRIEKQYFRQYACGEQWRVGIDENIIDTMQGITKHINVSPEVFFESMFACEVEVCESHYAQQWQGLAIKANGGVKKYAEQSVWSDFVAFRTIMPLVPNNVLLQLSNGMTVRYAQLFERVAGVDYYCNRGVSGIDGATSTALGASIASRLDVLLITGDMSFAYDVNGLTSQYNSKHLKIVVMCNDGGGIFRFIKGTSSLPELEEYFEVNRKVEVDKYAKAFGFEYFEAANEEQLASAFKSLMECETAAILAVKTPNVDSAETIKRFYKRNKQ